MRLPASLRGRAEACTCGGSARAPADGSALRGAGEKGRLAAIQRSFFRGLSEEAVCAGEAAQCATCLPEQLQPTSRVKNEVLPAPPPHAPARAAFPYEQDGLDPGSHRGCRQDRRGVDHHVHLERLQQRDLVQACGKVHVAKVAEVLRKRISEFLLPASAAGSGREDHLGWPLMPKRYR